MIYVKHYKITRMTKRQQNTPTGIFLHILRNNAKLSHTPDTLPPLHRKAFSEKSIRQNGFSHPKKCLRLCAKAPSSLGKTTFPLPATAQRAPPMEQWECVNAKMPLRQRRKGHAIAPQRPHVYAAPAMRLRRKRIANISARKPSANAPHHHDSTTH